MTESLNFFLAVLTLDKKMCLFLKILCFTNEDNGYLLEASSYNFNNKNKIDIDNFKQISFLQLS